MYETIKKYYELGLYTEDNLKVFISVGWLTSEEYNMIVGSI